MPDHQDIQIHREVGSFGRLKLACPCLEFGNTVGHSRRPGEVVTGITLEVVESAKEREVSFDIFAGNEGEDVERG